MSLFKNMFVEVKNGTKITYSQSDLNKLDHTYDKEVLEQTERKVLTPYRREAEKVFLAQVRDYAFERILDKHLYTFSHMLVIPNPYGLAKQTAMVLFNSSKETKVRYRVSGDNGDDFETETGYTKRHRVPIMGLYAGRSNKIDMYLIDRENNILKHRLLRIYVSEPTVGMKNLMNIISEGKSDWQFKEWKLLTGKGFGPSVVDKNGDIRYSLQLKTHASGMIPMNNGHFLLVDRSASCINRFGRIQPCRYHEMDYMGRVYQTFIIGEPIGKTVFQQGDVIFFSTSSDEDHENDTISEMNLKTGEVISRLELKDVIGDKYMTESDWCGISGIDYKDDKMLITLKKLSMVVVIEWSSKNVICVLGDDSEVKNEDSLDMTGLCDSGWHGKNILLDFGNERGAFLVDIEKFVVKEAVDVEMRPEKIEHMWKFSPEIISYCHPIDYKKQPIYGRLPAPKPFEGDLPPETENRVQREFFGRLHVCENLFLFSMIPGVVERIYFVGREHVYVQEYSMLKPSENGRKVTFAIQMDELEPDEYIIYLDLGGVMRRRKNEIRVL